MKIHNMANGVPPLDVLSTFFPLYTILNIFGLTSVYRDKGRIKLSPLLWKSILVFVLLMIAPLINIICFYMRISVRPTEVTFTAIARIFHLLGNFQYLVDVYFVHKYGKESFINYISVYQYIDKCLGRTCYKQIQRRIRKICLFVSVISVVVFIFNATSFSINFGWIISVVNSLEYVFYFFKILNALDMISNTIQVKYRLKIIADLLKDIYYNNDRMSYAFQNIAYKLFITINHVDTPKQASYSHNTIMVLNRCYLLLFKQCNYINTMYGFRVLLHNMLFVIDMIMILNLMIRLLFGPLVMKHSWLPFVATAAGLAVLCTVFYFGVRCCEQSYRQTERITFWSENLLINKKLTPDIQEALKELNSLVQLKPISYHVLHIYKVEYGGIKSIVSAVVTYTIILLQNVT